MTLAKRLRAAGSEDDPLVSRLAARLEPAMRRAFLAAVRGAAGAVDLAALESALASGQVSAAEAVPNAAETNQPALTSR